MTTTLLTLPSVSVIPAKAGIQFTRSALTPWVPAFAGMTKGEFA